MLPVIAAGYYLPTYLPNLPFIVSILQRVPRGPAKGKDSRGVIVHMHNSLLLFIYYLRSLLSVALRRLFSEIDQGLFLRCGEIMVSAIRSRRKSL